MISPDETIDALYLAYNAHDAASAADLHAPDSWVEETATGRRRQGREALREGLQRLFVMLPDVNWVQRERVRSGNSVVVFYTMSGHLAIDLGPIRGTGQPIVLPGVHVFDLAENTIASMRDYWDAIDFKRQVSQELHQGGATA